MRAKQKNQSKQMDPGVEAARARRLYMLFSFEIIIVSECLAFPKGTRHKRYRNKTQWSNAQNQPNQLEK